MAAEEGSRCKFPACTLGDDPAPKPCPFPDCQELLHHSCFTSFCAKHGIKDPEGDIDRYCWSCVAFMLSPDDEEIAAAVIAESAQPIPEVVVIPTTQQVLVDDTDGHLFGEGSTLPTPSSAASPSRSAVPASTEPLPAASEPPPAEEPSPSEEPIASGLR